MYPLVLHGVFLQDFAIDVGDYSLDKSGISIVFPRSSGILEGIASGIPNGGEVIIECPPNWYENNDLLGFALYCVGFPPGFGSCSNKFYLEAQVSEQRHWDSFSFDSSYWDCDELETACVICYPKAAIKEYYRSNQWTYFTASFFNEARVQWCGIHLIYAKDYEQMHDPSMLLGNSCHGNLGDHGSPTEDDYSKAHNKRSPIEQSPVDESHHKRFRGTQD